MEELEGLPRVLGRTLLVKFSLFNLGLPFAVCRHMPKLATDDTLVLLFKGDQLTEDGEVGLPKSGDKGPR